MNNSSAIKLINISKKYILHHQKPTLVENIFKIGRKETIWALKNINLEIKKGENVGIVGDNGSGKTTLLKIAAGITAPTEGKIIVNGRMASLIDLEAGFHPDLTGEENTYLSGMLLGMSKEKVKRNFDKIVKFSGLGKFFDAPLHTYSNGMILRLGFSIAVHSNPDILLIDEIMAVGDQDFKDKSFQKMHDFFKKGKTILFISHHLHLVSKLCSKTVWLEKGKIKKIGASNKIIKSYVNKN